MKKKILEILEEGKKYGSTNEAIANELLILHFDANIVNIVMQSEYPPEYIRIACAEYYKRNTPIRAIKLIKKYTKMDATTAKAYCDAHFA